LKNFNKHVTISEAQEMVKKFLEEMPPNWTLMHNRFYIFTHMLEEVGEVARNITYLELKRRNKDFEEARSELARELSDVLYHIFKIAIAYEINLEDAFITRLNEIRRRFKGE